MRTMGKTTAVQANVERSFEYEPHASSCQAALDTLATHTHTKTGPKASVLGPAVRLF